MASGDLKNRKEEIEVLVKASQDGDHDAFSELYDIFIDPIYRYVYFRVNAENAEDLVEIVFLKVWENIQKYKKKKKIYFSSWIFKIAHNLVVDHYRSHKDIGSLELNIQIPDQNRQHNPIKSTQNILNQKTLKFAINKLKKSHQQILIYKFINEFSNREIAELLKKSEGSLRILQFRALKALKKELKDIGFEY